MHHNIATKGHLTLKLYSKQLNEIVGKAYPMMMNGRKIDGLKLKLLMLLLPKLQNSSRHNRIAAAKTGGDDHGD